MADNNKCVEEHKVDDKVIETVHKCYKAIECLIKAGGVEFDENEFSDALLEQLKSPNGKELLKELLPEIKKLNSEIQ